MAKRRKMNWFDLVNRGLQWSAITYMLKIAIQEGVID